MRFSKWVAPTTSMMGNTLVVQIGSAGLAWIAGYQVVGCIVAMLLGSGILLIYTYIASLPQAIKGDAERRVRSSQIVHLTTPEGAKLIREAGARHGREGWVQILPSVSWVDWIELLGKEPGCFAFCGIPTRREAVKMVGKKATVAIIIDPTDVGGEICTRKIDGAIFLPGGYFGPAKVVEFEPSETRKAVRQAQAASPT